MQKGKSRGGTPYELAIVENIDGGFASKDSGALYAAELRIIPMPGASCIRFSSTPSKNKADAERAHDYLSKLIDP